jgi:hypothetical protein
MSGTVAIIGAGIAGLAAARVLREAGHACTLFDKSRGLGGRMATRRVEAMQFDHGAQYFTARGPRFRAVVEDWRARGKAAPWFEDAHVGVPGMSAPARLLLDGEAVATGATVAALRRDAGGWTVCDAAGPVDTPANGSFGAVVLAVPAPQAIPIAASAGVDFPALAGVRYAPCWALMAAFAAPAGVAGDRIRAEGADLSWIARDASKPGRGGAVDTVVAHASPEWSRRHLELGADDVRQRMLALLADATGNRAAPVFAAAHRWRYALVEQAAGAPFLWDAQARIGACGDWCLGPRVEAAFDSGEALAAAVAAG